MRVYIFDVGYGSCAGILTPNGRVLLLDCARHSPEGWSPHKELVGAWVDTLFFLNLDEDHLSGLPELLSQVPIGALFSNPSVASAQLAHLKAEGGMCRGVFRAHTLFANLGAPFAGDWATQDLGGVVWRAFWNRYPAFQSTNDLSLVLFVEFGGFVILFGGDMEEKGWENLMLSPEFRALLPRVNVFVASHHGRENGRHEDLMAAMQPNLVIFSDGPKQFGSQDTTDWYRQRTTGVLDLDEHGQIRDRRRRVMTTRANGRIVIDANRFGGFWARYGRDDRKQIEPQAALGLGRGAWGQAFMSA